MRAALTALTALATRASGPVTPWTPTDPSTDPPGTPAQQTVPDPPDADSSALRFQSGVDPVIVTVSPDGDWLGDITVAVSRSQQLRDINQTPGGSLDYRAVIIMRAGQYATDQSIPMAPWSTIMGDTGDPADVVITSTADSPEGGAIDCGAPMAMEAVTLTCPPCPPGTAEPPFGGPKYPIHWHGGGPFNLAHVVLENLNPTSHGTACIGIDCEHTGDAPGLQMHAVTAATLNQWGINSHNNTPGGAWTTRMKNCDFSRTANIHFTTAQPGIDRWHVQDCQVPAWQVLGIPAYSDVASQVVDAATPITWTTN